MEDLQFFEYYRTLLLIFKKYWHLWHFMQGSRWTLQAMLMDGRIDYLDWTIKPDQMMTLFPFFGFLFLVTFDIFINPLLKLVGIREPWKKFTLSGILAAMAYICAAQLQFNIFVSPSKNYIVGSKIQIWIFIVIFHNVRIIIFFRMFFLETRCSKPITIFSSFSGKHDCDTARRSTSQYLQQLRLRCDPEFLVVRRSFYWTPGNGQLQLHARYKRRYRRSIITIRPGMF